MPRWYPRGFPNGKKGGLIHIQTASIYKLGKVIFNITRLDHQRVTIYYLYLKEKVISTHLHKCLFRKK